MPVDLNNYNPMYVATPTDRAGKYIVTSEEWSALWKLISLQTNNTSEAVKTLLTKLISELWADNAAEFVKNPELVAGSGTTVASQLAWLKVFTDTKMNTHILASSSDHDNRYYTETEINAFLQTLQNAINADVANLNTHKVSSDHDGRYYTESEVDGMLATKSVAALACIPTQYVAVGGETNIPLNSSYYNPTLDILEASINSCELSLTVNYTLGINKISIDLVGFAAATGDVFDFKIFKNTRQSLVGADGSLLNDKSIPINKLTQDIQDKINDVENKADSTTLSAHLIDLIDHVPYGVTTGIANTYAVALDPVPTAYTDGMAVSVKINIDSTAASTINVNGLGAKSIKKANGNDVTNLKANGVYTLRYNSTTGNFILQGEGGSGDATASDLLSGKTAVTDAGDIVGTMPDKTGSGTAITPSGIDQAIPQGYYDGSVSSGKVSGRTVSAGDTILLASLSETFMYDNGNMTKRKEIAISASGIIRVKFDLRTDAMGYTANGRIYVNGIAVGTLRTMTNQNYATYTEDIACNNNDLIQIYMCSAGSHSAYVRNFEICVSSNQYGTVNM